MNDTEISDMENRKKHQLMKKISENAQKTSTYLLTNLNDTTIFYKLYANTSQLVHILRPRVEFRSPRL